MVVALILIQHLCPLWLSMKHLDMVSLLEWYWLFATKVYQESSQVKYQKVLSCWTRFSAMKYKNDSAFILILTPNNQQDSFKMIVFVKVSCPYGFVTWLKTLLAALFCVCYMSMYFLERLIDSCRYPASRATSNSDFGVSVFKASLAAICMWIRL